MKNFIVIFLILFIPSFSFSQVSGKANVSVNIVKLNSDSIFETTVYTFMFTDKKLVFSEKEQDYIFKDTVYYGDIVLPKHIRPEIIYQEYLKLSGIEISRNKFFHKWIYNPDEECNKIYEKIFRLNYSSNEVMDPP